VQHFTETHLYLEWRVWNMCKTFFEGPFYVRSKFSGVRSSHGLCAHAHTHSLEGTLVSTCGSWAKHTIILFVFLEYTDSVQQRLKNSVPGRKLTLSTHPYLTHTYTITSIAPLTDEHLHKQACTYIHAFICSDVQELDMASPTNNTFNCNFSLESIEVLLITASYKS